MERINIIVDSKKVLKQQVLDMDYGSVSAYIRRLIAEDLIKDVTDGELDE